MVTDAEAGVALRQERLRLHRQILPLSVAASATLAGVLAVALWGTAPRSAMLVWLAALAMALALRAGVGWAALRDAGSDARAARWLLRHRLAYAVHGGVWAAVPVLLVRDGTGAPVELVVFALAAMVAGSFISAAFDLVAAACFALPPVLATAVAGVTHGSGTGTALWTMASLFVAVTVVGAARGQRTVHQSVQLRLAAARRADQVRETSARADGAHRQLADQHQLLMQLLQTTQQGFWFIDRDACTSDLNPAMARLLGRPREAVLGRRAHEFLDGDDLTVLQHQLAARAEGTPGQYEVGITRPDGTRVHCVCHATPICDAAGRQVGSVGIWTDISEHRQTEAMLRGYELVVNSITDPVSVVDTEERYLLVNDAWCRATGVAREAALSRRSREAAPTTVSDARRDALRACAASGQRRTARGRSLGPGLHDRALETTYFPRLGEDGRVQAIAMVTRDITEQEAQRAALEVREAEQRAFLEAFPGYIVRMDAALNYTWVNQRLAALVGRTPEGLLEQGLQGLVGTDIASQRQQRLQRVLAGEVVVFEQQVPQPGGAPPLELQVTMTPGVDPATGAPAVYGFGIDITARKRAEEALIAARDEAERANRAKSQFLSQMSHELRTPLNAILGFGQLLDAAPGAPLPPQQQGWVREILRGGGHLLGLINEILDLGRIEAGELLLEPAPLDLQALVAECLGLVQALAASRHVRLHDAPAALQGLHVAADRRRLMQVLLNLLGNAIKYNRAGGEVWVLCRCDGDELWLAVRDNGPGLAPDEQARLFQPFERLSATQSGIEGTGIGLALSRRLVEAMGGRIGVDSQPGAGSTFWLRLPQSAQRADGPAAAVPLTAGTAQATANPAAAQTVLYIEDNPVNVVLMEAMLARLPGLRVVCALKPSEGLRLAHSERPALVLLDIQLPEMDGFEVLARLRADPATRSLPVVAVSANALPVDIDTALAAGFSAYITKPLVLEELLATVQRALHGGRSGLSR